jgi:ribonuclease-3
MQKNHREIEQAIGYRFRRKMLLERAVTHPSYRYEHPEADGDNQRMEYLGDAVLSLVCAEHLYSSRPDAQEGDMSRMRSRLTEDRKLAEIGSAIGLGGHLRLGHGERLNGGAERASNLADGVEAILGAAWVDGGLRAVRKIFAKLFVPELETLQTAAPPDNPKGDLQEYVQSLGHGIPAYETIETAGPEHDRTFTVELAACGRKWTSSANSKREAERLAALKALRELTLSDSASSQT